MAAPSSDVVTTQQAVTRMVEAVQQGDVAGLKAAAKALARVGGARGAGTDQVVASVKDRLGRGMLHFAAQHGQVAMVEHLVTKLDFPVDAQDNEGETPLALAAAANEAKAVKKLMALGADPRKRKDDTATGAIHRAAAAGSSTDSEPPAALRVLVEEAMLDVDTPSRTGTPLCWAAGAGHAAAVKYLLKAGADPHNAGSGEGAMPALSLAAGAGSCACVAALLAAGARVTDVGRMGATALHVAAAVHGKPEEGVQVVGLLLEAGADTSCKDHAGLTPLEVAVASDNTAVAERLLPVTPPEAVPGVEPWDLPTLGQHVAKVVQAKLEEQRRAAGESSSSQRAVVIPEPEEPCKDRAAQWKRKGDEAFVAKQYDDSVSAYTTSLRHDTRNAIVWSNRAAAYLRLEQPEAALHDAGVARALDPTFAKAWYREGSAYAMMKKWEDAAAAFFEGCNLAPGNSEFEAAFKSAVQSGRAEHQA